MNSERCPACGKLVGEIVRIRQDGNVTVLLVRVEGDGVEGDEVIEVEHRCDDRSS